MGRSCGECAVRSRSETFDVGRPCFTIHCSKSSAWCCSWCFFECDPEPEPALCLPALVAFVPCCGPVVETAPTDACAAVLTVFNSLGSGLRALCRGPESLWPLAEPQNSVLSLSCVSGRRPWPHAERAPLWPGLANLPRAEDEGQEEEVEEKEEEEGAAAEEEEAATWRPLTGATSHLAASAETTWPGIDAPRGPACRCPQRDSAPPALQELPRVFVPHLQPVGVRHVSSSSPRYTLKADFFSSYPVARPAWHRYLTRGCA